MSNGDFKVQVGIGADASQLEAGMEEAKSQVQAGVEQIKGSLQSMSSETQKAGSEMADSLRSMQDQFYSLGKVAAAVVPQLAGIATGVGAIVGAVGLMKSSISFTQEWAGQVLRLSQMLGISTEEASALNVALGQMAAESLRSDVTIESFYGLIQAFTRGLYQNEQQINAWGIATRQGPNKEFRNLLDIMLDVIKKLDGMKDGIAKNEAMFALFKRRAEEVRPALKLTNQVIEEGRAQAEKYNLVIGRDGIAASQQYAKASHEMTLAIEGFKESIGAGMLGALASFIEKLSQACLWMSNYNAEAAKYWREHPEEEGAGIATLIRVGGGGPLVAPPPKPAEARPGGGPDLGALAKDKGGGAGAGGPGLLQQWRDELEQIKAAEESFFDFSKEREKAFWEAKLALCQEGSAEWLGVRRQMYELDKAIAAEELAQAKETEESKAKLAEITADKKKALALIDLDIAKDKNAHLRAMDEIDKAEELRRQQELETKKYAIELQYLREHEKIELDKVKAEIEAGTKSALELQKLEDKKKEIVAKEQAQEEELQRKHQQTMLQLQEKEKEQEQSNWDQTLNRIGSDFNNLIGKLASGQKEMLSAFKSFCDSMVKTFIDAVEQMIMQWLDFQAIMTAAKVGFKAIGGIFGFQAGAWNIPHTMPAVLHPGEMVLPAPAAAAFRSAAVGGGALGGSGGAPGSSQVIVGPVHLTIPALDGADVERVLLNNPDAVGRVLKSLGRNFIPVGR